MLTTESGIHWARYRHWLAFCVLAFIVAFLPLLTIRLNSPQTNSSVMLAQVLFFLLLFRESLAVFHQVLAWPGGILIRLLIILALCLVVLSFMVSGGDDRALYYLSSIFFFFALVHFFGESDKNFQSVLWLKVLSVMAVSIVFGADIILGGEDYYSNVIFDPPVYRNIRHYNYDLMMASGALYVLLLSRCIGFRTFSLLFAILSVFSVWTGGRGQLLSLLALVVLVLLSRCYREAAVGLCLLALAFFVVLISGESQLLLGQIDRTFDSAAMDKVSSGRLSLWLDTWNEALKGGWIGHGADSFRNFDIGPGFIVHPHNAFLQFFFEYGFVGLILSICFFVWSGLFCFKVIFISSSSGVSKGGASLMLSLYGYGLLDGIFYHAIPFSFVIVLGAVFFSELRRMHVDDWPGKSRLKAQ